MLQHGGPDRGCRVPGGDPPRDHVGRIHSRLTPVRRSSTEDLYEGELWDLEASNEISECQNASKPSPDPKPFL